MNKTVIGLLIAGVIVIGGVTLILTHKSTTKSDTTQSKTIKTGAAAYVSVDACNVLTQSIADQALGAPSTKGDTSAGDVSVGGVSVSNCVYSVKIDPSVNSANNTKGVSVLVRSASDSAGGADNADIFGSNEPAGVQTVSSIGDKAFFNPQFNQLNILKGNNYYIVTSYNGSPSNATLSSDLQLAKMLNLK